MSRAPQAAASASRGEMVSVVSSSAVVGVGGGGGGDDQVSDTRRTVAVEEAKAKMAAMTIDSSTAALASEIRSRAKVGGNLKTTK